ncbi:hypothetical protein EUX98_g6646 [Antrodiella citrinella]|uniref:Uncharacterized protein n=1 Tax=Antrodiella citrinella TaxID=2447956 RepID=A0A4S4MR04_9APHY|nr:hypothetical protein EUX98_g6646 [Antrodiella citrinella]
MSPVSTCTTETLVSPTDYVCKKSLSGDIEDMAGDDVASKDRLTEKYPNAYSDLGPVARSIVREPLPVHDHPIQHNWVSIGSRICDELESVGIMWTSVNPLAYANAGEPKPFCPLIMCVGVIPSSLLYEAAVAAAAVVKNILTDAGFPDIEVVFIESVVTRFADPRLLSFNPLVDRVPDLRKPFTPTLGLSIAPRKYPHHEGTASLYFRLSQDNKRVAVLTCAHVARPPSVYQNTDMSYQKSGQRREEIVALGTMGYDNAINAMMATIGDRLHSIDAWNVQLRRLGDPVEGESENVTDSRSDYLDLVTKARREIQRMKALHSEVSVEPYGFTKDWAFIELYNDKIDWTTFKGNKLWVGGNLSISEFGNTMFPQSNDRKNYSDRTDTSYITPYWWIEAQIKAKLPDCFLYEAVP